MHFRTFFYPRYKPLKTPYDCCIGLISGMGGGAQDEVNFLYDGTHVNDCKVSLPLVNQEFHCQ